MRHSNLTANVADGSIGSFWSSASDFRSTPNNGHQRTDPVGPVRANGGHAGADLEQAINELTATEPMNALPMLA